MLSRILRLLSERRSTQPHERDEYAEAFGDIPMINHGAEKSCTPEPAQAAAA